MSEGVEELISVKGHVICPVFICINYMGGRYLIQ